MATFSGIPVRYTDQPITYAVSDAVNGGQVVQADQTASATNGVPTVKVAAATSKLAIGVAIRPAAPAGTDPATDAAARPPNTTVARRGMVVPVTFKALSKFGDRLKCAATGCVTPAGATFTPKLVVGINVDPNGEVAATATGYMQIEV